MESIGRQSEEIIGEILTDLFDRQGFGDVWGSCDKETREEIQKKLTSIILKYLIQIELFYATEMNKLENTFAEITDDQNFWCDKKINPKESGYYLCYGRQSSMVNPLNLLGEWYDVMFYNISVNEWTDEGQSQSNSDDYGYVGFSHYQKLPNRPK